MLGERQVGGRAIKKRNVYGLTLIGGRSKCSSSDHYSSSNCSVNTRHHGTHAASGGEKGAPETQEKLVTAVGKIRVCVEG